MEWAFVKRLMLVVIVLVQIHGHKGCLEEERMGLLEFKAFVQSHSADAGGLLPSWVDERESDCCGWERVTCNTTTGHVMDLSLNRIRQLYNSDGTVWFLNVSLFQPFKELRSLDLSTNWFSGWIENEGFEKLSTLKKLENLDLGSNGFNNTMLPSLSPLTSLKTLSLSFVGLQGSFPAKELSTLKNLEMLDLSFNEISGTFREDMESLRRLDKLETLDLGFNWFNKSAIQSLSAFPSLKNLNLTRNTLIGGSFPAQELSVLENLEMLDISYVELDGSLSMQDSKSLSKLSKLKHLDLEGNHYDKEILSSWGALSSIKYLSLRRNGMEGTLSNQELANLSSLEALILSENRLNGTLPIQDFQNFSHLEILDLTDNDFTGSISPLIGTLSSLKALSLSGNKLNGSLPIQGLCELKKLQELHLSQNFFDGILPRCLNGLTSLRLLDLSMNQFTGDISATTIANLTSLEYIDLGHNSFRGSFSFSSFANHSRLEAVAFDSAFDSDNDEFEVESELSSWVPMFQLRILVLSNCNLNKLTRDIPTFLLNQSELIIVDLSHNNLKGTFPNWLVQNNTRLEFLSLRNNTFTGQFHLSPYPRVETYWMDVSHNQFDGQLQENMAEMVPNIVYLNLSRNAFEGGIRTSVCNLSVLATLDLSNNKFSGEVPKQLIAGCVPALVLLKLSNNSFHGQIFSENFNLLRIVELYLDNNHFTGTLSNVISRCTRLYVLDISNNMMSGEIQGWTGNMSALATLIMRNNSFEGPFPSALVPDRLLDLSHNSFSESFPLCSNLQNIKHIFLRNNAFTGSIPSAILTSSNLLTLDIRDNFLSDSIPSLIGGLSNLRVLLLSGNHLSGMIPYELCQLNKIGLMDLSNNSFSGSIPHCFNNIAFGNSGVNDNVFTQETFRRWTMPALDSYVNVLKIHTQGLHNVMILDYGYDFQAEVGFVTKYRYGSYKGAIINYMSGLDLSCNKLIGEIPHELGKLSSIRAMNFSHNHLTGSIPSTFSNLTQIESLDLSYNNLSGQIPSQLIDLNFLSVFTVAYNNLSGRLPDMKAQFGTFENSSYDGNTFLCGPPLEQECTTTHPPTASSDESELKWYEIDPVVFSASFSASYIIFLLGGATILYINPHWRRRWFNFIEECFYSCYYFLYDTLYKQSACLRS